MVTAPVVKEGWYSADRQYSPPMVKYEPAIRKDKDNRRNGGDFAVGVYAICEFNATNYLNFAQEP